MNGPALIAAPPAEAHRVLPLGVHAVADARHFADRTLAAWGAHEELTGSTVLVVSELVTNAVLYGYGAATLLLRHEGAELLVEVGDRSAALPTRRLTVEDSEVGRGMHIIEAVTTAWGVRPEARRSGKVVWCRLLWAPDGAATPTGPPDPPTMPSTQTSTQMPTP